MLEINVQQNALVAKIIPPFNMDDIHEVIEQVEEAEEQEVKSVILDMESVGMMTSSMIGLLVALYKNLLEIQVNLGLSGLIEENATTLNMAGLGKILPHFSDVASGIAVLTK